MRMKVSEADGGPRPFPPVDPHERRGQAIGNTVGPGRHRDAREEGRTFGQYQGEIASSGQTIKLGHERLLAPNRQVGQSPGGHHDGQGIVADSFHQWGEVVDRVADQHQGRIAMGQGNRSAGLVEPLRLVWPLAGHQPTGLTPISEVNGRKIKPDAGRDRWSFGGYRRPVVTAEGARKREGRIGVHLAVPRLVTIPVVVEQQVEPGTGTNLHQAERAKSTGRRSGCICANLRECGKQRSTAADLVGLGRTGAQAMGHVIVGEGQVSEVGPGIVVAVTDRSDRVCQRPVPGPEVMAFSTQQHVMHGREQQVRNALGVPGQQKPGRNLVIFDGALREVPVQRELEGGMVGELLERERQSAYL